MDRNKYFEEYNKKFKKEVENISTYIFENPELGLKEFKSCRYLTNILKKHGFDVEEEYMGMDTAFRAEYGSDNGVTIAFLAEYDALPGYDEKKGAAHACGHNFIAACSSGAGIFLADIMKQEKIPGKVVVIGTPAEESVGGKVGVRVRLRFRVRLVIKPIPLCRYSLARKGILFGGCRWC